MTKTKRDIDKELMYKKLMPSSPKASRNTKEYPKIDKKHKHWFLLLMDTY